jgi:hypothetical protein
MFGNSVRRPVRILLLDASDELAMLLKNVRLAA